MQLYYSPTSPFVRKIMVLLHETGQLEDVEKLPTSGTPLAPAKGLPAHNPLGKVPALARDGAPTLYDSRVICQFLDDRARASLYGEGESKWSNLVIEATADGIVDAALLMVYERRLRPDDKQFHDYIESQWHKVEQAVEALDQKWLSNLSGPLSIGQIAVGCALGYLDFRHDARGWRKNAGGLDDWYAKFSERPSMKATIPAG
ncbi:glutathione S-transferase N-terminal domain-containing protein [Halocynthiibacter sp. C4]|uniref:glutathione S-transferase n=1 Tax=Halocynthiibacter sp. C4 TaxID=2992758 RepID=UPI00237A7134|nr:glutathione S-transferase N-terminal domain-containing protein [Halocynthiibacter sp. C4]MDE0590872.1 glutathione S-transferase N-terminal domain-containing protein [Halocynthiibacter sp. C4]